MTTAEREKMLAEMTRAEKAELLRWIVQDLANTWNFVRSHRAEIDAQIEANEKGLLINPPNYKKANVIGDRRYDESDS